MQQKVDLYEEAARVAMQFDGEGQEFVKQASLEKQAEQEALDDEPEQPE